MDGWLSEDGVVHGGDDVVVVMWAGGGPEAR